MTDRPIIFSAPMVRALLAGRKTQTRRLLSQARVFATPDRPAFTLKGEHMTRALQGASRFRHLDGTGWFWEADAFEWQAPAERTGWMANIAYAPGDRLYVRENWKPHSLYAGVKPREIPPSNVFYAADERYAPSNTPWVPCIHMPRWASRLTLTVEEVRLERLQAISETDAQAEGVDRLVINDAGASYAGFPEGTYRCGFAGIWSHLHGAESWVMNPFVVALTFRVERGNIDRIAA